MLPHEELVQLFNQLPWRSFEMHTLGGRLVSTDEQVHRPAHVLFVVIPSKAQLELAMQGQQVQTQLLVLCIVQFCV